MKAKFGIVLLLSVVMGFAIGATRTTKTHIMDVELARPVKGAEGVQILNVTIFDKVTTAQARTMLRSQLELCVSVFQPTDNILAIAWDADEKQLGDNLIYDVKAKKVMTMDEHSGITHQGKNADGYFIDTENGKTLEGIKPEKHWITLTLVYSKAPVIQAAYTAAVKEAESAASKGLDVNVYVSVGDKTDRDGWQQLKDPAGGYVFVNYDAKTKKISRKDKVFNR